MLRHALVLVPLLSLVLIPFGHAGSFSPDCVPESDPSAQTLDAGPAGAFYTRVYTIQGNDWTEVWHETNGVPGLQRDPTWNCGGPGDALLVQRCVGRTCPATSI